MTLSRIQPSLSLSFSPGPCWKGTSERLGADVRGPGALPHERPVQDFWTRTAELVEGAPTGPAVGPGEAEPGLAAVGSVGSGLGG